MHPAASSASAASSSTSLANLEQRIQYVNIDVLDNKAKIARLQFQHEDLTSAIADINARVATMEQRIQDVINSVEDMQNQLKAVMDMIFPSSR
jgi:chromosome segregation ATPase